MKTISYDVRSQAGSTFGSYKISKVTTYEVDNALNLMEEEMPANTQRAWNGKWNQYRDPQWYGGGYSREGALRTGNQVMSAINELKPVVWEGTLNKLKRLKAPANKKAVAREMKRKRKRSKGDVGNEVDIHMVRQGQLDRAWTRMRFEEREVHGSKHVHLVVNCSMHSGITPDQAEWRSAMLIAVHDELVRLGKSVSISLTWPSRGPFVQSNRDELFHFYAPVKGSGQVMSQRHLAAYTSAAFIRLFMLSRFHNLPGRTVEFNYGAPASLSYDALPYPVKVQKERGQHIVLLHACFNQSTAESTIEKVIAQVTTATTDVGKESLDQLIR